MSYTSALVIEALDSTQATVSTLTLKGGGLPKQGAAWGIEVVVPTTWSAGNPDDATQQVIVAKEAPSEWEGEWNLTRLNRAPCSFSGPQGQVPNLVSPGFLADVFEDMARKGQLLRVTWNVASDDVAIARTIVRLGRIQKFTAKYVRSVDLEWQCTFSWKSRGGLQARVVSTRDANLGSTSALLVPLQAALNALATQAKILTITPGVPLSASNFSLGQLENLLKAPGEFVKAFTNSLGRIVNQANAIANLVNEARGIPFEIANAFVSLARNTVQAANQFQDDMNFRPPELQSLSDNIADVARSVRYYGQVEDASTNTANVAFDAMVSMQTAKATIAGSSVKSTAGAQPSGILAVRHVHAGDTPQSLSLRYYGTVDRDVDILRANHLPWHQVKLTPGTILVIPVVSSNQRT